jgi:hypothetical protein
MSQTLEQRALRADGKRRCPGCKVALPEQMFFSTRAGNCRPCSAAYQKEYRSREHVAEARKHQRRRQKYGISAEQFEALLAAQNGCCAICRGTEPAGKGDWHVDHDHACCAGVKSCGSCIRGLLCSRCNTALGSFRDSPDLLLAAAAYLIQTRDVLGEIAKE